MNPSLPPLFASSDEETLASMLDSIGDAVCMTDQDMVFVAANRLFAEFYRLNDPRKLLRKSAFEVYPEFKKSVFYEACQATIETGETTTRFGYSANLENWVVIRCYRARANRYVMVVHRVTQGTGKPEYSTAVDPLTSLPNRLAFEQDAQGLRDYGQQEIGLSLLDISHFKNLNETLGFSVGDKFLMIVAARIKQAALSTDRVYRIGNDQFLVMGRGDPEDRSARRRALIDALALPVTVDNTPYVLQFHVGTHVSEQPETASEALVKAERALFMAKTQRTYEVHYSPAMGASNYDPKLTKEIQDALSLGQFEVFFQPQVDALDGLALGSEALLRWRHPDRGMVPPDRFLPFAEDTGLIEYIDQHVIRLVFSQMKKWQAQGRHWPVSLNLSAQSICNPAIADLFREQLALTGVNSDLIGIEITETSLVHDEKASQDVIESLKAMGLEIGIDDFGTGYASMSYLARYPSHALKIDRSFVQDMETDGAQRAMVKNMIALARSLGIKVIAEGVETEGQAALLREFDCDVLQGYLFAPALPLAQFEAWIDKTGMGRFGSDIR